jgi:hypothetical protein
MDETLVPIVIEVREVQYSKLACSTDVTLLGMVMEVRERQ